MVFRPCGGGITHNSLWRLPIATSEEPYVSQVVPLCPRPAAVGLAIALLLVSRTIYRRKFITPNLPPGPRGLPHHRSTVLSVHRQ